MTDALSDVTILVPGELIGHAIEQVARSFRLIRIEDSDPALIDPETAGAVRGIAGMAAISAAFIDALPRLEIIAHFGVGYDAVDVHHAARRGVLVTITPRLAACWTSTPS